MTSAAGAPEPQTMDPKHPETASVPPASGGGHRYFLSKLPFMKSSQAAPQQQQQQQPQTDGSSPSPVPSALQQLQQQKTRRRRGSLRKVALLGRRDRRNMESESESAPHVAEAAGPPNPPPTISVPDQLPSPEQSPTPTDTSTTLSIQIKPPLGSRSSPGASPAWATLPPIDIPPNTTVVQASSPTTTYSTTDDEESLHMRRRTSAQSSSLSRPAASLMTASESYFSGSSLMPPGRPTIQRRRSVQRAKSPLALGSLTTSPLPSAGSQCGATTGGGGGGTGEHDYSETERWGWIILATTWAVFAVGMGSVTGYWGWTWDVGGEVWYPAWLEAWDDPTLPIPGYYPALSIVTFVMVWVWVTVSWMGMKYFRHAKINGDH